MQSHWTRNQRTSSFFVCLKILFIYFERERACGGGAEEERESQAGSTASAEPHRGLSSHNPEIMT